MTQQNITLTHPLVNSGTAILLPGAKVSYEWKNRTVANPAVAKFDIVPGNYQGFENPVIVIGGTISTVEMSSNYLTQQLLVNLSTILSTIPITLVVPTSSSGSTELPFTSTPTYLGGRPTAGYVNDGTNTLLNSIKVWIEDWSLDIDENSELGHIWRYNLTLREVI